MLSDMIVVANSQNKIRTFKHQYQCRHSDDITVVKLDLSFNFSLIPLSCLIIDDL